MMKHFLTIKIMVGLLFLVAALSAQNAHKDLRKADKAYQDKNFSEAEVGYRRALEKQNSTSGNYNLGSATYRQDRYDEAVKHYGAAAENAKDATTKSRAYHNLGNAHFQKGEYKESVEAYKNALRQNPNDFDTKRNLANALRRIPPPPPQQQNQQNQQGDGEQKKNDQQNQPQDSKPSDEKQDQSEDEQKDQNQKPQSSGQKEKPQDLSKEEARQLLEIMDQEEQKVQEKMKKAQSRKKKSAKDW